VQAKFSRAGLRHIPEDFSHFIVQQLTEECASARRSSKLHIEIQTNGTPYSRGYKL
jgi:hypothetical protein